MDWEKYLKKTNFAADTKKILNAFRVGKILTYMDLQNAPIRLGASVAGYSTYQLVAELNAAIAAEEASDVPPIVEATAASVASESKVETPKKTEQPKKAPKAEKRTGSRGRQGASADKAEKA